MEVWRIVVRVLCAYVFLLALLRTSGKRTVREGTPFDFVLVIILGDMVDDAIWADVPFTQFVVATASLVMMRLVLTLPKLRTAGAGARRR